MRVNLASLFGGRVLSLERGSSMLPDPGACTRLVVVFRKMVDAREEEAPTNAARTVRDEASCSNTRLDVCPLFGRALKGK